MRGGTLRAGAMILRAAILALCVPVAATAACRHALALGLDVSGSVDAVEYRLQLDGLAAALQSEAVQAVLFQQPDAPVSISIYEWSGPTDQTVIQPWMALNDPAQLNRLVTVLHGHQRQAAAPTTAIGAAMMTGFALLDQQPACWRRTLDISGDGAANTGPRPQDIAPHLVPVGVIVNGLVVAAADDTELAAYYRSYVIRGAGAFVETARGFEDYAAAMERKLLRELQSIAIGSL
ncbi:DUF1194 domain-containing protein [Yoonia tamlensis]|uniref:DUF1194 domain-containing protein n=1 Tax=Yoonia tamlensis TaxID=390270 RepID=UPI001F614B8B|nr:DUF1194 domain-containing protein [Yoonia tamlensis]